MDEEKRQEESDLARKVKSLEEKEEVVLARAVAATMKAYNENPTTKNLKEWDAAKKRFAEFQRSKDANAEPRFANLLEALEYLAEQGWKVSQSKLYQDKGKIEKERDGSYTKKALDDYARMCLEKISGDEAEQKEGREKARLENDIQREKLEKLRRDNEIEAGKWVLKSDVESMLAGRAALLTKGLGPEFIHGHAADIIRLVNGDQAKTPELTEYWLRAMEEQFHRYSEPMEFAVPVQAKGNDEDE